MAAMGPYGIEQVDVPGVLGAVQAMQGNRIKMMMEQKQLETMERQANIQAGTMKALQAYATASSGGSTGGSGTSAPNSSGGAPTGSGMPNAAVAAMAPDPLAPLPASSTAAPAPAAPVANAPTPYIPTDQELAARKQVLTSLSVLNPEMGTQLADTFSKMDANQVAAVTQRHTRMAQLAAGILQLPQAQRQQAIQAAAPELQQLGLSPQQIAGFQPTDGNLRQLVAEGMDIERIAQMSTPSDKIIPQGGSLVSSEPNGETSTAYESPTMVGPNGEVFQRPQSLSNMPHPITATGKNGQKIQFNPQTKQWEPMGGQTATPSGTFQ